MLQVSRTQVPDHWLECSLKNAVPQSADVTKLDHIRYSSQTINKELYSELLNWCSLDVDTTLTTPTNQPASLQKDRTSTKTIKALSHPPPSYSDSELEASSKSRSTVMQKDLDFEAFLDPTTRAVGFDLSCLEGLDDLVIYSPTKALSELFWEAAVRAPVSADHLNPTISYHNSPFPLPTRTRPRQPLLESPFVGWSSDSDTDSDECHTDQDEDQYAEPRIAGSLAIRGLAPYNLSDGREQCFTMEERPSLTSFVSFESHFPSSNYKSAVGDFPKQADNRGRSIPNRFATFCANIPTKVSFGRSAVY
ncbi:hypothetical protein BJ165DRAFT_1467301 [Panaeolus papilionaceus]|nr:hypothetical protein BJ165DRAFT_1467301 [Panaeolus papilionaceus]